MRYLKQQRAALGGTVPRRSLAGEAIEVPQLQVFNKQLEGTGERSMSTTMAFARMLSVLLKEQTIASRVIPIVPDEARTFGLEPLFNRIGIYSTAGQLYEPADAGTLTAYTEREDGQVLEEGLNEAGAFATWMAAATSYSSHRFTLIPFYIYYSMFGFQRVGDLAWAAGDIQARGFLLGATAGRTTLNGEGLQHQDGHSHLLASTIPNCIAYDPCYAYELAVIVHSGLRRMIQEGENVFFYITLMNESYPHPGMPAGVEQDILKGMYTLRTVGEDSDKRVRLLGSGTILREVEAAANMLHERYGVYSEIFSVTSFTELARQGQDTQRWNMLHPESTPRRSHVADMLPGENPVIAASDFQKAVADQIRSQITAPYHVLGTDGFGRSDSRAALREFFEVDRRFIVLAALKGLCDCGILPAETVEQARSDLDIDPEKANPRVS
jgi:pyruvate dehydrogenase E1 component